MRQRYFEWDVALHQETLVDRLRECTQSLSCLSFRGKLYALYKLVIRKRFFNCIKMHFFPIWICDWHIHFCKCVHFFTGRLPWLFNKGLNFVFEKLRGVDIEKSTEVQTIWDKADNSVQWEEFLFKCNKAQNSTEYSIQTDFVFGEINSISAKPLKFPIVVAFTYSISFKMSL
jgi:hypothetical protein